MGTIRDLVKVYADYRNPDPLADLLEENFPFAFLIRAGISKRLQGLKKILGIE